MKVWFAITLVVSGLLVRKIHSTIEILLSVSHLLIKSRYRRLLLIFEICSIFIPIDSQVRRVWNPSCYSRRALGGRDIDSVDRAS